MTFNFSPRNLTQVTSTMKPGQDSMFGFSSFPCNLVLRPLYGVPSSPRALHKTLDCYFKSEGLTNAGFEESVWCRPADAKYATDIIISCHVDDSLIACSSLLVMHKFKSACSSALLAMTRAQSHNISAASSSLIDPIVPLNSCKQPILNASSAPLTCG